MTISESVAMGRALATLDSFPQGRITARQAAAMFVAMAESQVGYVSGSPNWSIYGKPENWRTSHWDGRQVYWCAMFGGWTGDFCFGLEAGLAGFGLQTTHPGWPPVGGTWTVWVYNWAYANGRVVGFDDAREGDILLTNWGRTGAVVDHYDIVTGTRALDLLPVIGGNTSPGNASAGAGVYRAWRPRSRSVIVVRPDWDALVEVYNRNIIEEDSMSAAEVQELKDYIDKALAEKDTVEVSEGTGANLHTGRTGTQPRSWFLNLIANRVGRMDQRIASIEETVNLHTRQLNTVGRIARQSREYAKSAPERTIAFQVPFKKGTSAFRAFGETFRFGALQAYGALAFLRRDQQTAQIVEKVEDAIDTKILGNTEPHDDEETEPLMVESQADLDFAVDVDGEEKS